ncbi:MAG TPA: MOSC domain-containing protein [Chthoniobacteraceae bacterium]|jgi:MOSC domain-containing protein YiiM|nr:MOSC domain-containing protein [Chthoniobacteraceae bacterium]
MGTPRIEAIFVATKAGESMMRVTEIEAIAGVGLRDDRYATGEGYYAPSDVCEVTLIEGEVLDVIRTVHGVHVHNGEHRRNIVTRGLTLRELEGTRLRIGDVLLEYDRPRPPCSYVERITEKGMTRALGEGAGICLRVLQSGKLREGAEIEVLDSDRPAKRRLP